VIKCHCMWLRCSRRYRGAFGVGRSRRLSVLGRYDERFVPILSDPVGTVRERVSERPGLTYAHRICYKIERKLLSEKTGTQSGMVENLTGIVSAEAGFGCGWPGRGDAVGHHTK